jgi:hypothetical protein
MTRRSYLSAFTGSLVAAEIADAQDLSPFGIKADGLTDDTASIQKALDAAAKAGGSVVLPAARYRVAGNLKIPPGVGLEGVHHGPIGQGPLTGTVILTTAARDKEDAPPLFDMASGTSVRGLMVFYPGCSNRRTAGRKRCWFPISNWQRRITRSTCPLCFRASP